MAPLIPAIPAIAAGLSTAGSIITGINQAGQQREMMNRMHPEKTDEQKRLRKEILGRSINELPDTANPFKSQNPFQSAGVQSVDRLQAMREKLAALQQTAGQRGAQINANASAKPVMTNPFG